MVDKVRVECAELKLGMYVCELDRPWLETPFPFQGFALDSMESIEAVRRVCDYVFVDAELGIAPRRPVRTPALAAPGPATEVHKGGRPQSLASLPIAAAGRPVYPRRTDFEAELARARTLQTEGRALIGQVFRDVRLGKSLDPGDARAVVRSLTESILANPDALLWMMQLKRRDEYTSLHCLNVCILSLAFGRHLGLPRGALHELGLGALLHDIGKMRVPLEILNKPGRLEPQEFAVIQTHTGEGREILRVNSGLGNTVLDIVYGHHERRDGSGYPRRLSGDEISLFSRMVAIVDVYDAVTSDRVYHKAASPVATLGWMYEHRSELFDPGLVESFIQSLGIFPAGSVVEMTSGAVGVVIDASPERRLRPRVLLVLNPDKEPIDHPRVIDLAARPVDAAGRAFDVRLVLEPGSYGVHPADYLSGEFTAAEL